MTIEREISERSRGRGAAALYGIYCPRHERAFFVRGSDPDLLEKLQTLERECDVRMAKWIAGDLRLEIDAPAGAPLDA